MERTQPNTGKIIQVWNAPTKEQKFSDKWERIKAETRTLLKNEMIRKPENTEMSL